MIQPMPSGDQPLPPPSVGLSELDICKDGCSASASAALSLCVLLGRGKLRCNETAVTGVIDLRGRITMIGDFEDKVQNAMEDGVELFVAPSMNVKVGQLSPDQKAYFDRAGKGVDNIMELLEATVTGAF